MKQGSGQETVELQVLYAVKSVPVVCTGLCSMDVDAVKKKVKEAKQAFKAEKTPENKRVLKAAKAALVAVEFAQVALAAMLNNPTGGDDASADKKNKGKKRKAKAEDDDKDEESAGKKAKLCGADDDLGAAKQKLKAAKKAYKADKTDENKRQLKAAKAAKAAIEEGVATADKANLKRSAGAEEKTETQSKPEPVENTTGALKVFVGNIGYNVDDDTIKDFFADCGTIDALYR